MGDVEDVFVPGDLGKVAVPFEALTLTGDTGVSSFGSGAEMGFNGVAVSPGSCSSGGTAAWEEAPKLLKERRTSDSSCPLFVEGFFSTSSSSLKSCNTSPTSFSCPTSFPAGTSLKPFCLDSFSLLTT